MRPLLAATVVALALTAGLTPANAAPAECQGLQACISVPGPWVLVPAHGTAEYLLTCPRGRSVVGGLAAMASSRAVRVSFDGRLGAPVSPGVTTTTYALFRAVSISGRAQTFQPRLGCIPTQGGGGRTTVAYQVTPAGPSLDLRARTKRVGPGEEQSVQVACPGTERLAGSWEATAYRLKKPPKLGASTAVEVTRTVLGKRAVVTATATDALSIDVNAIVQVGVACAP